jgi:hypothetical protein
MTQIGQRANASDGIFIKAYSFYDQGHLYLQSKRLAALLVRLFTSPFILLMILSSSF